MASISTYAKLTKPPMFNPADGGNVKFKFECSRDLSGNSADLIVFGNYNANGLSGRRTLGTQPIIEETSGTMTAEFDIPATSIGTPPTPEQETEGVMYISGKMKACVVVYSGSYDFDTGEGIIFKSNEIYVDMVIKFLHDFIFYTPNYQPPHATGSTYTVILHYNARNAFGSIGSTDIASYRFFLYDSQRQLIEDSGELYDWNTSAGGMVISNGYTFRNLKNESTYYITAKATLNGGYTMYLEYEPLTVTYANIPVISNALKLESVTGGVKASLDTADVTYTHVAFARSEANVNDYLTFRDIYKDADNQSDTVSVIDSYAIPKRRYIYKATIYNEDTVVNTYYNIITHTSNVIVISDILGIYYIVGNITKTPINRNNRGGIAETIDSRYPFYTLNGAPNYETGTVGGMFAEIEDCQPDTDNIVHNKLLRTWLNNGRTKMLTHYTGEAWIVTVSDISTAEPDKDDVYETSFNWTQIGDIENLTDYVELGLITDYQGGDVV